MEKLLKYKLIFCLSLPLLIIFLILFLIIAVTGSVLSTPELAITSLFKLPFKETVEYTITSKYGERLDPFTNEISFHSGIDLGIIEGTEINSVYPGEVVEKGYQENGLGEYVKVRHKIETSLYATVYGHLKKYSTLVNVGDEVDENTILALSGSTGKSTGPHLHFEVHLLKKDGTLERKIDPINIFE